MAQRVENNSGDNVSVAESTVTLVESGSGQSSDDNNAAVDLFSRYGFGGSAPVLPPKPQKKTPAGKKATENSKTTSLARYLWSSSRS